MAGLTVPRKGVNELGPALDVIGDMIGASQEQTQNRHPNEHAVFCLQIRAIKMISAFCLVDFEKLKKTKNRVRRILFDYSTCLKYAALSSPSNSVEISSTLGKGCITTGRLRFGTAKFIICLSSNQFRYGLGRIFRVYPPSQAQYFTKILMCTLLCIISLDCFPIHPHF